MSLTRLSLSLSSLSRLSLSLSPLSLASLSLSPLSFAALSLALCLLEECYLRAPAERLVIYCQTTGVSAAHASHCATYYPVSAAHTNIFRMDSNSTSYQSPQSEGSTCCRTHLSGDEGETFPGKGLFINSQTRPLHANERNQATRKGTGP